MDTSKAKKNGKVTEKKECIEITSVAVSDVRVISTKKGDFIPFTLMLNGVTIYNCHVASGKNGDFISFPQTLGKNDKYYNVAYAPLSDDDTKMILEEVQAQLND